MKFVDHSRIVKLRTSLLTHAAATKMAARHYTVIQMRWADRLPMISPGRWRFSDNVEIGVDSAMRWEDVIVSKLALAPLSSQIAHPDTWSPLESLVPPAYALRVNEFSARVTIYNAFDADTYDWRDLRWLGSPTPSPDGGT